MILIWSGRERSSHMNLFASVPFCLERYIAVEEKYMKEAIKQAKKAESMNEVPIGAVIVYNGKIIARGYNRRLKKQRTVDHAEMMAIEKANKVIGSWRLEDCDLYVTLEPCQMCAGAIMQARIKNVYFGAYDKKAGVIGSLYNLYEIKGFNHYPGFQGGIMEKECSELLTNFFKNLRKKD